MREISIHALREESDPEIINEEEQLDISIHALREESDSYASLACWHISISIHALREESDAGEVAVLFGGQVISIHALREESDLTRGIMPSAPSIFLSTPSARRATAASVPRMAEEMEFLSTPSARRATMLIPL